MMLKIYAVFDDKAKAFIQPFYMLNDALAIRSFTNAVNTDKSQLNVNPEDYTLFAIGEFDDAGGKLVARNPELLVSGLQVRSS